MTDVNYEDIFRLDKKASKILRALSERSPEKAARIQKGLWHYFHILEIYGEGKRLFRRRSRLYSVSALELILTNLEVRLEVE